ncbi:(Fe-S)-binding protein, partial [Pseudomonas sp. HMWF006]|uniref:(Fe-S)-binding protein n=1 Tax=Pseudomonas sp. HMWF006 TaxID=2056843 RepID=UPI000D4E7F9F
FAGCCGMSGTYGLEARNRQTSAVIYEQSWARQIAEPAQKGEALATGYSCRSQVKRQSDQALRHPLQVLLEVLRR